MSCLEMISFAFMPFYVPGRKMLGFLQTSKTKAAEMKQLFMARGLWLGKIVLVLLWCL